MKTDEEKLASKRASEKKWREANKDKAAEAQRRWAAARPGYSTAKSADRYAATRARIASAMAQDVATRRNTEEL